MKKILVLVVALLATAMLFSGVALADEWYHGNDGTQPGIGVLACPAEGDGACQGVGEGIDNGLRQRFKDH